MSNESDTAAMKSQVHEMDRVIQQWRKQTAEYEKKHPTSRDIVEMQRRMIEEAGKLKEVIELQMRIGTWQQSERMHRTQISVSTERLRWLQKRIREAEEAVRALKKDLKAD